MDEYKTAELERYVDVLFADYRNSEIAQQQRLKILNDLLLEKEHLQMNGYSESQAVQQVLSTVYSREQTADNILVYHQKVTQDIKVSFMLWMLTGTIISVPIMVLGNYFFTAIFLVLSVLAVFKVLQNPKLTSDNNDELVFYDIDYYKLSNKRIWFIWMAYALLWCIVVSFFQSGADVVGLSDYIIYIMKYYPAVVFVVFPLWASGRRKFLFRHEVLNE